MKWATVKVWLEWDEPPDSDPDGTLPKNISPDTELSGSSYSSCQGWAAHPLIAITVSWPTFTSAYTAAYIQRSTACPPFALVFLALSGDLILSDEWEEVERKTAGQLEDRSNQATARETRFNT